MSIDLRPIPVEDAVASRQLGMEAFGVRPVPPGGIDPASWPPKNIRAWGAYDDGELVGKALVREFTSWFHGSRVPTAGMAGVTVAAERRGSGVLRPLFDAVLADAREHGEVVSTLFASSMGIYHGLGYEAIGSFHDVRIPMPTLARVSLPGGPVRARRTTAADLPEILRVYETWAAAQNGPLTRAEEPFALLADDMFGPDADYTGVTVALGPDDEVLGFASWKRGPGDDRSNAVEVDDLVALTPDAARVLWRTLGSFMSVVGDVQISTSGGWTGVDPARLAIPDHVATTASTHLYMLRILDVPGAVAAAHVPPVTARIPFAVVDPRTPDIEGAWTLVVADGKAHAEPDAAAPADPATDRLTFTSGGLAASYAGAMSAANLRLAGRLAGPTTHDALWDALWRGRDVHVRDNF